MIVLHFFSCADDSVPIEVVHASDEEGSKHDKKEVDCCVELEQLVIFVDPITRNDRLQIIYRPAQVQNIPHRAEVSQYCHIHLADRHIYYVLELDNTADLIRVSRICHLVGQYSTFNILIRNPHYCFRLEADFKIQLDICDILKVFIIYCKCILYIQAFV